MNVKDVMTPHVLSVTPDESIFIAARLMLEKKISGLPVVDGRGNLVGIVSGRNGWSFFSALVGLRTNTFRSAAARFATS
jgi:CBS-domain-containing membrane protein